MRVTSIDLYSNDNLVTTFDVNQRDVRNPYILKGITGLDADAIVPRFYATSTSGDGFYDMALEPREIVMKIGLNPDYRLGHDVSDLRGTLYRAIASSRRAAVQLRFNDDAATVGAITGFVTKFEGPVASKDLEVTITLRCNDPIFKSLYAVNAIVADLDTATPMLIDPVSTSPHGFKFRLTFTEATSYFAIQNNDVSLDWHFTITYDFEVDDQLLMSSEDGYKYLYLIRDAVTIYLMDSIYPSSVWPLIFPGENEYLIEGEDPWAGDFVWNEVYWHETHWGV